MSTEPNNAPRCANHEPQATNENILVWLPSPMGDAILCTPALRAIRKRFSRSGITFVANSVVRDILSPNNFNNDWLGQEEGISALAGKIKELDISEAILLKNSFGSALTVFLAGVPSRIGYARDWRDLLLTERLYPPKLPNGKFKPVSMIDYYLAIASWLGAETTDRNLELQINPEHPESLRAKLPELANASGPVIVLVPGGAFGPSKCWPSDRFAQTADRLIENYNATIVVSVASNNLEKRIAGEICSAGRNKFINLAERPVTLGELKALFSCAELVITNDTGPRHIAIALGRKIITLFGPNDPIWTETNCPNEIEIVGRAPCAPCAKPNCTKQKHLCMESITVEMVCDAAKRLLENEQRHAAAVSEQEFVEISESFFVDSDYEKAFNRLGLTSVDAVFSFSAGRNLTKDNLSGFRSRIQFEIERPATSQRTTFFLKRYDRPPLSTQLKNFFTTRSRTSCGGLEAKATINLKTSGISTPKVVAYGRQYGVFFEKKSFIVTEKLPNAEAIERKLPCCFDGPTTAENLRLRREFIADLAVFIRTFHQTGYRHRDLYFSHIFHGEDGNFHLIDLARAFEPLLLKERYRTKDIAQIYYSAPAGYFSRTDRLRFYIGYTQRHLTAEDKKFIHRVTARVNRMARHDIKHGRAVPFAT